VLNLYSGVNSILSVVKAEPAKPAADGVSQSADPPCGPFTSLADPFMVRSTVVPDFGTAIAAVWTKAARQSSQAALVRNVGRGMCEKMLNYRCTI
jgi:hypothetical protein